MSWRYLSTRAHAKINWTLEVLGKRPDGYHEVHTILQTIMLADHVTVWRSDQLSLSVRGTTRGLRREWRASPEQNLAYRAALLLRERAGVSAGARIQLSKRIPIAAGLGGGSSDAAAVLRCLRKLWQLDVSDDALSSLAAELGSDVPFFLRGGTALASGRGELLEPLPDVQPRRVFLAFPKISPPAGKTARMYAALRPEHYTGGSVTERLAGRLRAGEALRNEDPFNVFEAVLPSVQPDTAALFRRAADLGIEPPHLAGSGPFFYFLLEATPTGFVWNEAEKRSVERIQTVAPVASYATVTSEFASIVGEVA